jgi:hypothetical protein
MSNDQDGLCALTVETTVQNCRIACELTEILISNTRVSQCKPTMARAGRALFLTCSCARVLSVINLESVQKCRLIMFRDAYQGSRLPCEKERSAQEVL